MNKINSLCCLIWGILMFCTGFVILCAPVMTGIGYYDVMNIMFFGAKSAIILFAINLKFDKKRYDDNLKISNEIYTALWFAVKIIIFFILTSFFAEIIGWNDFSIILSINFIEGMGIVLYSIGRTLFRIYPY